MLTTLLSLFGGGIMRLLPELISLWNKKADNAHELAMLDKQFQLEQTREASKQAEIAQQGDIDQMLALLASQKVALSAQMQVTGIRIVDILNFLVRPLTTYYFLGMFGIYKAALLAVAMATQNIWQAILQVYTPDDAAMLAGILAFWFVGRVFDKKQQ
jgi:hypothetical protein